MPTIVKEPVKRSTCNLCGKQVAELPNGRLRYHSCHVDPGTRPTAEQLPQGYGADANGNPTPRSEAILAQSAPKEVTMTSATATAEAEDESQEILDENVNQEGPPEVVLAGKTVEDATPSKPKREKAPKEPKAPTETKVPESVLKARAERTALLDRSKAISKLTGTGDKIKVTLHMYDTDGDRTLCGAVVPANDEARKAQGWYVDTSPATAEQIAAAAECTTCQARIAKLQAGGPVRRRVARKPGEAEIGTAIVKAAKGTKDGDIQGVVHLTNAASEPLRTLCGALIGSEAEGWVPAEDPGVEIGCPTCRSREAKLTAAAETQAAMAESKNGSAD